MKLLNKTQSYLRHIAQSVDSLSCMVCCPEISDNVEMQYRIIMNMVELEQDTADFVDEIGLMNTAMQTVAISKYRFAELINTLKPENDTLKIEAERF